MDDVNSTAATQSKRMHRQIVDIAITLAVGAIFAIASYRILNPFIGLIVAGGVIAIAVFPLYEKAVARLGGRRKLAVTLFALLGIGVIVVPVVLISSSLFESAADLSEQVEEGAVRVPPPPSRVQDWPVVGTRIHGFWLQASTNLQAFVEKYNDQMKGVIGTMVSAVANAGAQVLQFIFAVVIAAILLANAEACKAGLDRLSNRLFGEHRGEEFNKIAAQTVRSVATGVLGVAFVQAVLAAIGMAVAGVPWIGAWCLAILVLAIVQLPPLIILLPVALWVFGNADNPVIAWGFMIWAILVSFSDAVLKPMFLGRGVDIPMIVILLGAIGGMIAGGIMGLFVGAVVLALAYRLFVEWLNEGDEQPETPSSEAAPEAT